MTLLNKLAEGIEQAIASVAPGWAASRAYHRLLINGYEAATPSRTHKASREHRAANNVMASAGRSLREQARWLDENHDIVIGLLDKMEERIVGSKGIQIEPQPRSVSGEVLTDLAEELRRRWGAWSLKPEVTGTFTRPQMERIVLRSWLRDGDVFGKHIRGAVPNYKHLTKTPYAIELLEADFVPDQMNDTGKNIVQGVQLNGWRRPVAYNVLLDHPGEATGIRFTTKAIPAENMMHLALRKRLHQVRGVSLLHGIITRLSDLKDVEEAERVAARISACLAFYIKKGDAESYQSPADGTAQAPRTLNIAPGMTFDDLRPGEEVGTIQSNRSNYSSIARDYDGSYSSQRQELVEGFEGYAVLQDEFVAMWSRPVYRAWLEMELLTDLQLPADLDRTSLMDAVYLAPVMPWIDPAKESEGWKAQIRGGAATETEWIRARGRHPDEVHRQRVQELKFNRDNGIVTDTDPANDSGANTNDQGKQATQPTDGEQSTGRPRQRGKQ
jgi:capsid protein